MIQTSNKYIRINKTKARKLFNKNIGIYIVPCKVACNFSNMWIQPFIINNQAGFSFDQLVNNFEYYNCNDNETGLYAAYYVEYFILPSIGYTG